MITEQKLIQLCTEILGDSGIFLVELHVKPGNRIMVFIDGDHGVKIEDCQKLSRMIEQKLDRNVEDYDLMVSSAGADRPLLIPRQFKKNIGKLLELTTADGIKAEGLLLTADDEVISVKQVTKKSKKETETKEIKLKYNEIKTAKVAISFKK